ncbi:sugar ABC transporter substrate-binding protein [Devosia algicola]|uniref:Sugar ABC transporter substrate-binding protein n=1 Tax=Devosia algicola TaxID=3026418 RepID=A0ABY7YL55_9HYPH|nr:sugar ABC transporter substrate-binding protein [Devosia algicola]WDR01983.1 sugar ABC transporter substrate-binding protein [Devosia algicola]
MKLIVSSALAVAMTVAGMAQVHAQEKLVIASFYPVDKVAGWDGLVNAFKAIHPNVEIEVQVTPFDQYLQKLTSQIAGGDSPDVAAVENTPFPQFVSRNILQDLTPYLENTPNFSLSDFFPALIDRYTVEGKVYGIPYDAQPRAMLFYNPAMLEAAGVDAPTDQWDWEDMRAAALKLSDASGSEPEFGLCMASDFQDSWTYFLYGGGGALVDDSKAPKMSMIDQQPAVDATNFYLDLMYKDKVMPTVQSLEAMGDPGDGCKTLFLNGRVAMMIGGMWLAVGSPEEFKALDIKVALGPVKDTANRVYPTGGTAYTILKSSDNQDLAWEFITQFLGQAGYENAYKEANLGAIYPPAHIPSFDWYAKQDIEFIDTLKPNEEALASIRFAPFTLNWAEVSSKCIQPDIDLIVRQQAEVEPTLAKITACVDAELTN